MSDSLPIRRVDEFATSTPITDSSSSGHGAQGEPATSLSHLSGDHETPELGPTAGRVITPGIDDVLDAFESEEDVVNANRELLEGRPLTVDERGKWQRLFHEIMHEANKRLAAKGIVLLAAAPEPNGLGGVLTGCDRASIDAASRGVAMPSEDYTVTVSLPARERVDIARSEREEFARRIIDLICSECVEQQKVYRAKAGVH